MGGVLPARREARLLIVGSLLNSVGSGMTLPFLYIYLHDVRDVGPTAVGAVVAWMGLLSLLLTGPTGALMDRFGVRPVIRPAQLLGAAGAASWAWVHTPWQAIVPATMMGLAGSAAFGGFNTMLSSVTEDEERQRAFGLAFAALNLGIGIGGVMAGFIADVHNPSYFTVLYAVDGLSWLLPFLILTLLLPTVGRRMAHSARDEADGARAGYREVFADRAYRRLFWFALLLMGCGYAQVEIGMPAFATSVAHVSTRVVALALVANSLVIVCGQVLVSARVQGHSRSKVLAVAAAVLALSWIVLGVAGLARSTTGLAIAACVLATSIFAVAETLFSPVLPALTNALATDELRARYNSMGSLVWGMTSIVGPLTAAPLIGHGLAAVWIVLLIVGLLAAAGVALSIRRLVTPAEDGVELVPASSG